MSRTRSINELRAIHAKKLYKKNGDIIQALKLKHGNSKLNHPDVFDKGRNRQGYENLNEYADIIAKYSIDPEAKFKVVTPIELSKTVKTKHGSGEIYEPSDGNHIQKYLYKGSGKIVEMSPDKFLNIVAPMNSGERAIFDENGKYKRDEKGNLIYTYQTPTSDDEKDYNQSSLKHLRKNMGVTSGQMPNITVELNDSGFLKVMGHEGRHRAFIAREKGIVKIPVMVATGHSDSIMPDEYKDLIKKEMFERQG